MVQAALRLLMGCLLFVVLLAGLYFMVPAASLPPRASADVLPAGSEVVQGFSGIVNFGHWRLICAPTGGTKHAALNGNCRVNQEVAPPGSPGQIILAANFSESAGHRPAVMLRLPPTLHDGDTVMLRFGGASLQTPVNECSPSQCVARVELSSEDWTRLTAAASLQAVMPTSLGQNALVDISPDGLTQAVAAMDRAEGIGAN